MSHDDHGELHELVRRASRGEPGAHDALHRRFAPVAHGIAVAEIGPNDADDVVQEVWVRVLKHLPDVRDAAAFPAWLAQVARSCAADARRRRARRPTVALDGEPVAPAHSDPADGELAVRVLDAVRQLPETYRHTLVLRLVEGLTGPEIAARTGMTHGSVRVNLTRGMGLLRPMLAGVLGGGEVVP